MKSCLKKSEVDTVGDPEKLNLIGWGPRQSRQPADAPGQPMNLDAIGFRITQARYMEATLAIAAKKKNKNGKIWTALRSSEKNY